MWQLWYKLYLILWPPHAKSWLIGKRLWCWEVLGAGGEGDDRGWDGWMASLTRWTWVWVNSGRCVLQSMGSQKVRHYWVTELSVKDYWVPEFNLVLRVIFKVLKKNLTQDSSLSLRAGSPFSFLSSKSSPSFLTHPNELSHYSVIFTRTGLTDTKEPQGPKHLLQFLQ